MHFSRYNHFQRRLIYFKHIQIPFLFHTHMSLQILMMYLHRYLRLTPALAVLMCVFMIIPPYLTSGPAAVTKETLTGTCDKWWWYNILYINNLDVGAGNCVGWVWYLANDMQFFILSPVFLYAFKVGKPYCHRVFSCGHATL